MRTIQVDIFPFEELNEQAQQHAIQEYREGMHDHLWLDAGIRSLQAFCEHFNIKINDWSIGLHSRPYVKTDSAPAHFRGLKLKSLDRDYMPTGYCIDCDFFMSFYDAFKLTGDAFDAFNHAISCGVRAIVSDLEHEQSDECISEQLINNEHEFLIDGTQYSI